MSLKEQLRLLSDMDGVWAHSQPPIIETFNKRFGTNLTYSDWTTFSLMTLEAVRLSGESIILKRMLPFLKSAILVDRPWNDKVILPEVIKRVGNWREEDYGWDEIVQIVQKLANES